MARKVIVQLISKHFIYLHHVECHINNSINCLFHMCTEILIICNTDTGACSGAGQIIKFGSIYRYAG